MEDNTYNMNQKFYDKYDKIAYGNILKVNYNCKNIKFELDKYQTKRYLNFHGKDKKEEQVKIFLGTNNVKDMKLNNNNYIYYKNANFDRYISIDQQKSRMNKFIRKKFIRSIKKQYNIGNAIIFTKTTSQIIEDENGTKTKFMINKPNFNNRKVLKAIHDFIKSNFTTLKINDDLELYTGYLSSGKINLIASAITGKEIKGNVWVYQKDYEFEDF